MTLKAADFGKVAVLMGGTAAERDVSLNSGNAVLAGLQRRGVDAHAVDVTGPGTLQEIAAGGFDRAFIVLHGRGGEDGVIQGALEMLGIPATGSDVTGSAICMDKYRTKLVWQGMRLPTPGFAVLRDENDLVTASELGFPLMVKPAHEGSSIGMRRVESLRELGEAWQEARQYDSDVLAECWITGAEYTATILGDQALPLIRLETPREFYDYQAKYVADDTRYLIPCGLDSEREAEIQALALQAFEGVGASGWGRVDLMIDGEERPWLIEVNTVPGMTDHSLVPMAAAAVGINFDELVWQILAQTLECA